MIHALLEGVALALIVGVTLFIVIGIHRAAPPAPSRDNERRQMRDERRRPGRKQ